MQWCIAFQSLNNYRGKLKQFNCHSFPYACYFTDRIHRRSNISFLYSWKLQEHCTSQLLLELTSQLLIRSGLFFLPKWSRGKDPLSGARGRKDLLLKFIAVDMIAFCKRRIKNKNTRPSRLFQAIAQHSYDVDKRSELDVNNQPIDNIDYVFDHGDPTQLLEGLSHKPSKFQNGGNSSHIGQVCS